MAPACGEALHALSTSSQAGSTAGLACGISFARFGVAVAVVVASFVVVVVVFVSVLLGMEGSPKAQYGFTEKLDG